FSSRRRHTRFSRDWSSDVCSSDLLCETLAQVQRDGEPYALLGASYSFVHLMDELQQKGLAFSLPPGSRLFDTGGFKGQSRELARSEERRVGKERRARRTPQQ